MSDKEQLKISALKEVIARDKVQYEDQIADLRVTLTETSQQLDQANSDNALLQQRIDEISATLDAKNNDVVVGEVVSEDEEG